MKHPDFVLVGASRCGSTSFFETLIKHPKVLLPSPDSDSLFRYEGGSIDLSQKEIRFFDRYWDKGVEWYFDRFQDVPGTITGDGSTMYLYLPDALRRLRRTLPDTKILILLRNPVDRLCSHYHHQCRIDAGWKSEHPSFEAFIDDELDGAHHHMVRRGFYLGVRQCFELFDRSQILITQSEDLFQEPEATMSTALRFLGLDDVPLGLAHLRKSNPKPMDEDLWYRIHEFYETHNQDLYELVGDFGW